MANIGKKTKGKQKIEIKMIENDNDWLITFSKRRSGIYKKIGELSTLCGNEILFIIFSPAGKPFTFSHPTIESIASRFLNGNIPVIDDMHTLIEVLRTVQSQMDASNETQKMLAQQETPLDKLNPRELYKRYSYFSKLLDLFHISRSKKIATTSSMLAPTGLVEDAPTNFPLS
ncbi:hypothetical protein ES288_A05G292000v1 [Gossypium darwinii]|uniref:MADS-box domain-containing protein n=1 Tax=Gossypium darwinii TaxID=34276 RepID=A0A5D2GN06_GOSDA|nr:hypothetical protein ES288_A05G292000v1 [Gossypium darwinii]